MKYLLKTEEIAMTILGIYLSSLLPNHPNWWLYSLFFFLPDVGMLGYVVSARVGALCYNIFHHKGIALTLYLTGLATSNHVLQFWGLVLFAHASFDRIWGYGLKFPSGFKHTHLGDL